MQLKTAIDCVEAVHSVRGSHLDVYGGCVEENLLVHLFIFFLSEHEDYMEANRCSPKADIS